MSKELQPHQQRVVDERVELQGKIDKLAIFIKTSPHYNELDAVDRTLLRTQLDTMRAYGNVLTLRIDRF